MADVFDVADYFVAASHKRDNSELTILRLQKLLYFAQLWSYLEYDRPLFNAELQAWMHGPVVASVSKKYSPGSNCPIDTDPVELDYSKFTSEELALLFDVDQFYKTMSTYSLVSISHGKGSPWKQVYVPGQRYTVIPKEIIREFCRASKHKSVPRFSKKLPDLLKVSIPKRNANGVALLPRDTFED